MQTLAKTVLASLLLMGSALQAGAISRYETTTRTCDQVRRILAEQGAAILQSRAVGGATVYDRYVAGRRFCLSGSETLEWKSVRASGGACPVMRCVEVELPRSLDR